MVIKSQIANAFWIILEKPANDKSLVCGNLDNIEIEGVSIDLLDATASITAGAPSDHELMDEENQEHLTKCWLYLKFNNEPFAEGAITDYHIIRWSASGSRSVKITFDLSITRTEWLKHE